MSKTVERQSIVPFTPEQMFDLVNDIESYPQFMTGCAGAKVLERGENWLVAKLDLQKAGFQQSFTTRNQLSPPRQMTLELVDGPFKVFRGTWSFTAIAEHSCQVAFRLEFAFSNFLMGVAAGKVIEQLAGEQVTALCDRAKSLYTPSE